MVEESEKESETDDSHIFVGIKIKREFTILNLITIPLISLCTVMIGVYMNA